MYNRSVQTREWSEVPLHLPLEPGPLRLADYLRLPDEPRSEIWRGRRVVTPAPRFSHQTISAVMHEFLARHARSIGGRAVAAPVDVVLSDDTVVQPDLLLLTETSLAKADKLVSGAPDLVVEIVSSGEKRRDRLFKLHFYLEAGVPEYWIVDGDERTIEFLVLRDGRYALEPAPEEIYRSPTLPGLELPLARLWKAIEDPRAGL